MGTITLKVPKLATGIGEVMVVVPCKRMVKFAVMSAPVPVPVVGVVAIGALEPSMTVM